RVASTRIGIGSSGNAILDLNGGGALRPPPTVPTPLMRINQKEVINSVRSRKEIESNEKLYKYDKKLCHCRSS
ncbi:hypothetical protein, partial [Baia soyae]|uniref:hypothetical protein n=1 Tax=Baia soyae TaxID=1544746 RepID=UPI001A9F2B75